MTDNLLDFPRKPAPHGLDFDAMGKERAAVPMKVLSFPRPLVSTVEPAPLPDNFRTVVWLHRKGRPVEIRGRWA